MMDRKSELIEWLTKSDAKSDDEILACLCEFLRAKAKELDITGCVFNVWDAAKALKDCTREVDLDEEPDPFEFYEDDEEDEDDD